jgi:glycosyltransferase involved in cell wall biosynthesis
MSRIMGFIHDRIEDAGHEVDHLCSDDAPRYAQGRLARFGFPFFVRARAVAAARASRPYRVVNVHEPHAAPIAISPGSAGRPVIVVMSHGVEQRAWELALEERRLGREGPGLKARLSYPATILWQTGIGLRRAHHVLCLNLEDRDFLVDRFHIPEARITRIYPGADLLFAELAQDRNYGKLRNILFAGTWRPNKGIKDLVAAFAELALRHPTLRLNVLGAGIPEQTVRTAFPDAVQGNIVIAQARNDRETASVFAQADLFLLPSVFEGTPLTLLEAMMSGLPIVTTATCGMKDVIEDGRTGVLIPTRSPQHIIDAVEHLLRDAIARRTLGQAAQDRARRYFTWDAVAQPVLSLYEHLASA